MSSQTTSTPGKVLIVGAGLGGLVLAHILKRNEVPFELFERDDRVNSRAQGWAIALVESLPGLRELLPPELVEKLPSNSVNVVTGEPDTIAFVNATTGEVVGTVGGKPLYEPGCLLRSSREAFRRFLWEGGEMSVSTSKHFTHFTQDSSTVTAHFHDGSSATGTLLLGADGAHSHTLDQLIGKANHNPALARIVPIFAEYDIPPRIYEPLRKLGNAVILAHAPNLYLQIGIMTMKPDRSSAHYFMAVMPHPDDPKPLSDWVQHASKQELYDYIVSLTKDLAPFVKDLIAYGGVEAIVQQARFIEFETPNSLPSEGRVSVLGDAAHSMIPFRGAGANTAILDACDLGRMLAAKHREGGDFASVLSGYHEVMVPRGQENVRSSHAAGEMDEREWVKIFRRAEQ